MRTLVIGGDICPIGRNESLFQTGNVRDILSDLADEFEQSDASIVNLECPLVDQGSPILKTGPNLKVSESCVRAIAEMGIDAVNLANNHIMDFGAYGLERTIDVCASAGIATFGAGKNLKESQRLHIRTIDGRRVAVLGLAEREWSIASDTSWGAAPLDPIEFLEIVRSNANFYDLLIVLVHGGVEYYPYPTPKMQKTYRFLADNGAAAVICQHTHCAGCYEIYNGVPIVYGQGNFIFDGFPNVSAQWTRGFLVKLTIDDNYRCGIALVPFVQSDGQPGVRRLLGGELTSFLGEIETRSEEIQDVSFVSANWKQYCRKKRHKFSHALKGKSRWFCSLSRRIPLDVFVYQKLWHAEMLNRARCDSLREFQETVLESLVDDFVGNSTTK